MEALATRFCRSRRISSSLPSSLDLLRAPFGVAEPSALGPCRGQSFPDPFRDEVPLDLNEQHEESGHDFGLDVALAAEVLLRGRDPQIGNGFHGLTMECGF